MADISSNPQSNYHVSSDFDQMDGGDVYDKRCAEIFITLNRVLVFHCSFCDKRYRSFEYLLEHLSIQHYEETQEQEEYGTILEANIKPDLEQITEESYNTESSSLVGALDETLHEYDKLQSSGIIKVEERSESEISDEDRQSELQDDEEYLEEIENVVILHKPHNRSDETRSTDQMIVEEKITLLRRRRSRGLHTNANEENKPEKKGKKLMKCDICSKTFNRKDTMKMHLITHSSERKHKCEYCGLAFKGRSNLLAHVHRRHTGQKNIDCDICSKKFFTRTECGHHMRIHTGEKPYICSFCGLAFQTASKMTAHSKRHTEKAPLECTYCKKEFWVKQDMKDHLLVHTKEKPFSCPICSARFPRRRSLRRHAKLHEK